MLPHCRRLQKIEHLEGGKGSCAEHYIAMLATALFCVSPCYVASMRSSLRQKYDIQVRPQGQGGVWSLEVQESIHAFTRAQASGFPWVVGWLSGLL